ncbi:histidine phosphatase family protein [Pleionea sediminis]|uniref:histidine phosphatase family protein n=1 Tax=Pleionea sediminis TaxID=2569479 RepID=UPI0011852F43|nr:histidine phosphatase family protein [Pleionea sediminis]
MKTTLTLIRHGEPQLTNALLGTTDSALSKLGIEQLTETFNCLDNIDVLISSPLSRCSEFATAYSGENNIPLIIDKEWQECHFGDWDGMLYEKLNLDFPERVDAFFRDPAANTPPFGESLSDFSDRVESALLKLLHTHKGQDISVLTHAGVIRTIVAWCLDIKYSSGIQYQKFALNYASITRISIEDDEIGNHFPQLVSLNNRDHLSNVK